VLKDKQQPKVCNIIKAKSLLTNRSTLTCPQQLLKVPKANKEYAGGVDPSER